MSNFSKLDINLVIQLTKQLFENSRCTFCEHSSGKHMTYFCGHTACDGCISVSDSCLYCITPPEINQYPVSDPVLTKRVHNANRLLKACQETFNIDVYKRQRLSDQLKIEKEIFPECIQAPLKYFNRNKSYCLTTKNKENRLLLLPGENITQLSTKMENSVNYVQQWLEKNERSLNRKPLSNINSNDLRMLNLKKGFNNNLITSSGVPKLGKKRCKTPLNLKKNLDSLKKLDDLIESTKQKKRKLTNETNLVIKSDNDESGIVIDDEVIVIGDSQITIDKDAKALLAVMEANKNTKTSPTSKYTKEMSTISKKQRLCSDYHVSFYKRSKLIETCSLCNCETSVKPEKDTKNISVTIENNSFTTVISIDTNQNTTKSKKTQSTLVQTDISDVSNNNDFIHTFLAQNKKNPALVEKSRRDLGNNILISVQQNVTNNSSAILNCIENQILTKEKRPLVKKDETSDRSERSHVVIADSDSDSDFECTTLEVAADIHRSDEDLGRVLTEIEDYEEHSRRLRRGPRGCTPNSSDSSEKENYNPNRQKNEKDYKKKSKKQ